MTERVRKSALFSALLWTLLAGGKSKIIVGPIDTEVRVGDSTYLNCSTSDPLAAVSWYHYPVVKGGTKEQRYVYFNGHLFNPYDTRFKIERDTSTSSCNLVILKAELQDAGVYVCHDGGSDKSTTAQLIILEGDPTCLSNISPLGFVGPNECDLQRDTILLSCSITYRGNVPSTLEWTRVKGGYSFPISDTLLTCSRSDTIGNIVCNYTAESDIDYDGSFYICKTRASINNHYECSTDVAEIHYAINDKVSISKKVGDSAVCIATTISLSCDYKWIWSDGVRKEIISESSSLAISRGGWHQCEATCKFRDTECTFDVMVVNAFTETIVKKLHVIFIIVEITIGALLFAAVLFIYSFVSSVTARGGGSPRSNTLIATPDPISEVETNGNEDGS